MIAAVENVMVHAGASWGLWVLLALSALGVAVMVQRARVFRAQQDDTPRLVSDLHRLLRAADVSGARQRLERASGLAPAVALVGLVQWDAGRTTVRAAMAAATRRERARLERHLLFVGTRGTTTPLVGVLGTVIGLVGAFDVLGELAPEHVMTSVPEALVATAVGLVIALPVVTLYQYCQGLLADTMGDVDALGCVILAHVGGDGARRELSGALRHRPAQRALR